MKTPLTLIASCSILFLSIVLLSAGLVWPFVGGVLLAAWIAGTLIPNTKK